jgi:hypothetical protein
MEALLLKQRLAVVVACFLLHSSIWAAGEPQAAVPSNEVREQVRRLPAGSRLEVKLKDHKRLKGKLGSVDEQGFEIRTGAITPVRVAFVDVQSMRHKTGMSTKTKVGIGVGIFLGMGALVAYLLLSAIARNG